MRYAHVVNGFVQQYFGMLPRKVTLANGTKVSNPHGSRAELANKFGIYEVKEEDLELFQEHGQPYVDDLYVILPAQDLPVEQVKLKLTEAAKVEKRRALAAGCVVEGIYLDTDDTALSRLTGAAMSASADKIYLLRDRENVNHHVKGEVIKKAQHDVYSFWYSVMEGYWNFLESMKAMNTIDELRSHAVILDYGF